MFELSVALKYLIPKRKQLSVSLISLMSVGVISLVVWLLLLFLSITEGIEKGWLEKLTALNAPVRINPTPAYFNSYYYQIDSVSETSSFLYKSIGEKAEALISDPYSMDSDMEIPAYWPVIDKDSDGSIKDPVKKAYQILKNKGLIYQDYEISGALMRLELIRSKSQLITTHGDLTQSNLTQASYVASFAENSPYVQSLISKPDAKDLNNLFYLANLHTLSLDSLLKQVDIKSVKTSSNYWRFPPELLPEKKQFFVEPYLSQGKLSHFIFNKKKGEPLVRLGNTLIFRGESYPLSTIFFTTEEMYFTVKNVDGASKQNLRDVCFDVEGSLQGEMFSGKIAWDGLEIADATIHHLEKIAPASSSGVFLAKSYQENGVRIGDRGYLSYTAPTASSIQEQRLPIYVAGFYDPGIMAVGNKCILAPGPIVHAINISNHSAHLNPSEANGIHVWFPNLNDAKKIKKEIITAFKESGIDNYWKVSTFHEYDFARDLMQQFQSDRYLFTLIGIIILTVACCNIISLLVLLVNDKKKEIGILQSMGASTKSIAAIFGLCGITMGILSSLIGIGAAFLTLHHIDIVVSLLSILQGHDAFNAAFYGKSLPSSLSHNALIFILIATPIISLLAGLVPAIKACRLRPSAILRSE
ncbi:MAG: FtsX-like permease family protein [Chlamydiota bacterium]